MQTPQPTPGAGTAPTPAPPAAPGAFDVVVAPPRTAQELAALRAARRELSSQLTSASERRDEVARKLRNPMVAGPDRTGLEERVRLLDQRIVRLEADIATTGRQITSAPASLVASERVADTFGGLPPAGIIGGGIVFTLSVLAPLAIAAARLMWRRGRPGPHSAPSWDDSPRLQRLEQAVDAIALEVERVSEGQRYVTRLIAESHGAPSVRVEARRAPEALPASGWPEG